MAQQQIQKRRTACYKQARTEAYRSLDAQTERVLEDALKASKRARNLLRTLKEV